MYEAYEKFIVDNPMSNSSDDKMSPIKAAKSVLRKSITTAMRNMTITECIQQSDILQNKLMNMREWINASRVSVYLSMEKEVHTNLLVENALRDGKECFVPFCHAGHMKMLKLKDSDDYITLPKNSWGIKEPKQIDGRDDALETGGLDLVVVPGVAFTVNGFRLGHGKGYYDRFLAALLKLPNQSPPKTIALAFHQQIVKTIPTSQFDMKIDQVLYTMATDT